jgi:O-antigen ligase
MSLPEHAGRVARWAAVAIGFSLPLSTALDTALAALLLLGVLASGGYAQMLAALRANRFVAFPLAFFVLHVAGASYSAGTPADVLRALDKASTVLFVPLLVAMQPQAQIRELALRAFMAASLLALAASFLLWWGLLPEGGWVKGVQADPVVFKKHITHGVLMAFAAYLFALKSLDATGRTAKLLLGAAAALAAFNVLYMVHGRTGQLVLIALACYALWRRFRWRGVALAALACAAVAGTVYFATSSGVHHRVKQTLTELDDWRAGRPSKASNRRPETWGNSVEIMRQHSLLGVGTGGFAAAYVKQVEGTSMEAFRQPENQYLLTAVQLGAVGLVALLALFAAQWHLAGRLAGRTDAELARGLVITMAIGCLFNSFLLDHTEALFYAWLSGLLYAGLQPASGRA